MSEIIVINPYTGKEVGRVPRGTAGDIEDAVNLVKQGAQEMRQMSLFSRSEILRKTSDRLLDETESMATLIVSETGKTIREARAEVARASGIFQLASEETRRIHGETIPFDSMPNGAGKSGYWIREPVGIVGAITPWNVPLALSAHKIASAIGAGNAVIHKPAEQSPLNALRLAEILYQSGMPEKALRVMTGDGETTGDALVAHPDVGFISFTGSREVGMRIPSRAGYKRIALELGGNSPVLVMESANIERAAEAIARGGFAVAGQLCISVQRVIVHESVRDSLQTAIVRRVESLILGDPMSESTDMGTLISEAACARVTEPIKAACESGAALLTGGKRLGPTSYAPTVLADLPVDCRLLTEEAFAPLLIIIRCRNIAQAISIANATPYGLNAGIFTNDLRESKIAVRELDFGTIMINDVPSFRSDLMPYGGRKQSGMGREGVRFAMDEMTELKVICTNEN